MYKTTFFLMLLSAPLFSQEFSSAMKLQYYANACNAAQTEVLLKNDSVFDIYASGVTLSPVMVAVERYITANNNQNLKSCTECRLTIQTIMRDSRYKWKRNNSLNQTDFMHLLSKGKSVTNSTLYLSGYDILLGVMINELKTKNDFDINYTLPANMPNIPSNALGAVASKGLKSTFCTLLNLYPFLKYNLDKRPNEQHYPALMLASAGNNLEMVKTLAANGSDFYLKVIGFDKFPSEEIAQQQGFTEIATYLNKRRLGNEPVVKNGECFE